jgi:heme oxygenase
LGRLPAGNSLCRKTNYSLIKRTALSFNGATFVKKLPLMEIHTQYADLFDMLKAETKEAHRQTEKAMMTRMRGIKNLEDYQKFLKLLYEFYKPLEEQIEKHVDSSHIPDLKLRRKASLLVSDISAPVTEEIDSPIAITSLSKAIGSLYVLEGSTMGGVIIAQMLQKSLKQDQIPVSFFRAYGDKPADMWMKFKEHVRLLGKQLDTSEVLEGAVETFNTFEEHLKH